MISLTPLERKAILILFKDVHSYYNANNISKILKISHVGAQKLLKRLLKDGIVLDKKIGKSIIYRLDLNDEYVKKLLSFLLIDESKRFNRWREEFKGLSRKDQVVLLYGSTIIDYEKARDIDIMIILDKKNAKEVNDALKLRQDFLPKKIHSINITKEDLIENIKNKNKVTIEIIKNAIVLYGQDKYIDILKNVSSI